MYEIFSDVGKNRMYLTVRGNISVTERVEIAKVLQGELAKLRPGFSMVSDTSEVQAASEENRQGMQQMMKAMKDAGMGHVVRIVANLVVSNQWQRTSRSVGYTAESAASREEADRMLDELEREK